MRYIRQLFIFAWMLMEIPAMACGKTRITINTQEDFDRMTASIEKALEEGARQIEVVIGTGTFYFRNNQLRLEGKKYKNVKLRVLGKGTVIMSKGADYFDGSAYTGQFRVDNAVVAGGRLVPVWSDVMEAEGAVEVVDEEAHLCRVKCKGLANMTEELLKNAYIRIPQWFLMNSYKISKIKGGYAYFTYRGLQKIPGVGWNVNDDCHYGGVKNVRYFLCNVGDDDKSFRIVDGKVRLPKGVKKIHECTAYQFCTLKDCEFKSIRISGLTIVGNAWYMSYLMSLENVATDAIKINDCSFECLESNVISIKKTPHVTIANCTFKNCYRGCVYSDIDSQNTTVTKCRFERVGLDFENTSAVRCQGSNYLIADNAFLDYGYCAVALGYGKTRRADQIISGVTERNTISFSPDYVKQYKGSMLMDGGAIYVMTQNDQCVIRYNNITGHTGMKDNRGIFCDDGAYNVEIYGNVVTRIENSYCIDSRRVAGVEKNGSRGANVTKTNVNNKVYENIVDGTIRFEPREGDDNGCMLGENYVVKAKTANNKVTVSKSDYKRIKNSQSWKYVRNVVSQK